MSGSAWRVAVDSPPSPDPSDASLLDRLAAGADESALSELYDRYQAQMYGLAVRITGDAALAQDAVQDAFVGIWRNAARYSTQRGSARTWVLSITHHRAIDILRRRRTVSSLPEAEGAGGEALVVPDIWPEVERSVDRDEVRRAIDRLPDLQRRAIELAYFEGLTQAEIAERTGAPLGTVKSRVRLGLRQLRSLLEGRE